MSEPSPETVDALFQQAIDLDLERRSAFLDEQCDGDADLRAAVEELLQFDAKAQSAPDFLQSPTADIRAALPLRADSMPALFGRYRIVRLHGEGGMGTVYEADQNHPRRTVALKVIRRGLVSPEHLKRFRHEAQILARLQHPGIAQVYEAGMSEDGQPFFAMEFIRGMPLDVYARSHGLDAAARLELLARVCDAVQHAHDRGVIHRDLKPGNILVDQSGQPKVLDFGVAHVTAADLGTTASRTQTGQLLGTLSYMSPEQIAAHPTALDGRSDVYTLGVILFELLAHRLPYQLEHLPMHEVARVIQQQEPSRLGSINGLYRGDIEVIVHKALEKDKTRRYASAGDLASDIRRYLRGEPIFARPASALYQLRKFVRRHKGLVAGVSCTFLALLVGTVVSIAFAVRAAEYARLANERERGAIYQSYRARIAAAVAALSQHNVVDAARELDAAPETLRGWEWQHLHTRLDDSIAVFPAATGEFQFLMRDPKGIRIAGLTRASVRLTDLDGNELLTRSYRPETRLLNRSPLLTRQGLRLVEAAARIPALARSPDSPTNPLNLLDEEGRVQAALKCPEGMEVAHLVVSPDGARLAVIWTGSKGWLFTLYDPASGLPGATFAQDIGYTHDLVFSSDGMRIATAGEDGVARVWDTSTATLTAECRGHTLKVLSVAFRPDGKRLVTASADGTVRQWEPTTGHEVQPPYDRHTGEILAAVYSPDGLRVASGGTDRTIRLWEVATRHDVAILHGHTGVVSELAFTADGRHLVSVSRLPALGYTRDGTARLWEVGVQAGSSVLRGHTSYVYPVAFSPDGQWIASGSWDKTVRLWDALTSESCAMLPHEGFVRALAFTPDSSWLVSSGDPDESLDVWNVATSRRLRKVKGPGTPIQAIAMSPDGSRIAAACRGGSVSITEAATGEQVHSFPIAKNDGEKKALAYSPDGRLLASTGEEGSQIDVWDTQTRRRFARLTGHTGLVYSVEFSGDGRRLASASGDRTVRVWDVATAKCAAVLTGHTDEVFSAVFQPGGKRLASAGRDRAIWLWDLATGQEVARLEGHTNYVFSLAFSPDGRSLVSGSGDGTVRIWDTVPMARRHQARREAESLRPESDRLVGALFREKHDDSAEVAAALWVDQSLSQPQRKAALRAVLRRSAVRSEAGPRGG